MPLLDVSDIVTDADLADVFNVVRRHASVTQKGRPESANQRFEKQFGVVTIAKPDETIRRDDMQNTPRTIFVAARFEFRGVADASHPDLIEWAGTTYTVLMVQPYSRYGRGIHECTAESQNAVDKAM